MVPELYSAATTGTNLELFTQFKDKLGDERTGSENTVLHLASQFGQLEAVKRILSHNRQLLLECNDKGEYALHLAARGGHSSVVQELINCAKEMPSDSGDIEEGGAGRVERAKDKIMKWGGHLSVVRELINCAKEMPSDSGDNEEGGAGRVERAKDKIMKSVTYPNGYTALHEAVQSRHVDVVKMLIEEDPECSYSIAKDKYEKDEKEKYEVDKYLMEKWETPLYLAARRGFDELVDVILTKCKSPAYSGPNGKTALHGAVISNSKRCAELLLNWKTDLAGKKDSNGQTPLHFVALLGYADLVSPLLLSDKSVAYIKDYMFNKAIHIAASRDHVSVLKEIMLSCPDSWDMEGFCGQNILHMAVNHQQKNVIEYILEECPIIDALHQNTRNVTVQNRDNMPLSLFKTVTL